MTEKSGGTIYHPIDWYWTTNGLKDLINESPTTNKQLCLCNSESTVKYAQRYFLERPKFSHPEINELLDFLVDEKNVRHWSAEARKIVVELLYMSDIAHEKFGDKDRYLPSLVQQRYNIEYDPALCMINLLDRNNLLEHGGGIRCAWRTDEGTFFIQQYDPQQIILKEMLQWEGELPQQQGN